MLPGRRLATLVVVAVLVGAPAVALRAMCVGKACAGASRSEAPAPFCSLDPQVRDLVTAGFYEDRSPDVLAVTRSVTAVTRIPGGLEVGWPVEDASLADGSVPLVFLGNAVEPGHLPDGARLDQVAPTLEPALGLERPHPEVRSGTAVDGVVTKGEPAPLVVLIVMKGVGTAEVTTEDLARALGKSGLPMASGSAAAGSLPLDPAAVLTTIGTGALPSDHGITGTWLRAADGGIAQAFAPGSPVPVVASLGDDLDGSTDGEALVGLIASHPTDRGLIGGAWYPGEDDDVVTIEKGDPVGAVDAMLRSGFGDGGAADLMGISLQAPAKRMTADAAEAVERLRAAVPDALFIVTATGSLALGENAVPIDGIWRGDRKVATPGTGGVFIDRDAVGEPVTAQEMVASMSQMAATDGSPLFADVFPSFAVRFGDYC